MFTQRSGLVGMFAALALVGTAQATVYVEASNGDLSNSGLAPTFIALTSGTNQITGATGNPGGGTDRDYFTVTIAPGQQLTSLTALTGTAPLGTGFIGVQVGAQVTVLPTSGSPVGLLGWLHYAASDVGTDILPRIGTGVGATGFVGALGAGSYSFWIQDFNPGSSPYSFQLNVSAVPEPSAALTWLGGLAGVAGAMAWQRRQRRQAA